jgi:hypothetical protein
LCVARRVCCECLDAGARDLGGVSPRDEVNPDFGFDALETLRADLESWGYALRARLPVHRRLLGRVPVAVREVADRTALPAWGSGEEGRDPGVGEFGQVARRNEGAAGSQLRIAV